jgi:hypothetical protein
MQMHKAYLLFAYHNFRNNSIQISTIQKNQFYIHLKTDLSHL